MLPPKPETSIVCLIIVDKGVMFRKEPGSVNVCFQLHVMDIGCNIKRSMMLTRQDLLILFIETEERDSSSGKRIALSVIHCQEELRFSSLSIEKVVG